MPSLGLALNIIKPLSFSGGDKSAPTFATATNTKNTPGDRTNEFTFTAPDPAPGSYEIEQRYNNEAWTTATPTNIVGNAYTFTALPDGIYQYRARAVYPEGNSGWATSNTITAFISMTFDLSSQFSLLQGGF